MRILSNNFSLAKMEKPLWPGCLSSNNPAYIEYMTKNNIHHFSWSSQSRGFFRKKYNYIDRLNGIPRINFTQVNYPAYLKSGGSLTITQNGNNVSGSIINGSNVAQYTGIQGVGQRSANTTINNIDTYVLAQTGAIRSYPIPSRDKQSTPLPRGDRSR